jgi:membrane-associated HD superfamily phosphohydrolase
MEKKLINLESKLTKWISNFILINRSKIYIFLPFCALIFIFSRMPFLNLILNDEINYTLILLAIILLFKISARTLSFLFILLLFSIMFITLLSTSLLVEKLSSAAFITFALMTIKLLFEYEE